MGGWLAAFGDTDGFDDRLRHFQRLFEVEGVPSLNIKVFADEPRLKIIGWAWNVHEIPDVAFQSNGRASVLLCGAVTEADEVKKNDISLPRVAAYILERTLRSESSDDVAKRLNGSFSIFAYRHESEYADLVTDRFASRSVWYSRDRSCWLIGNFPAGVASLCQQTPAIDPVGLWSLLNTGRPLSHHGIFSGVRSLLAGQTARLDSSGRQQIRRWYSRRYKPDNSRTPSQWGKELAQALVASSAKYRRVSHNPHLFLSGGLDSRIVAGAFDRSLKTITLCTSPNLETRLAGLVARTLKLEHETVVRSPYWYLETQDASSLISGGSYHLNHAHFTVPIANAVRSAPDREFLLGDVLENLNKHYFVTNGTDIPFSADSMPKFLASHVPATIKDVDRWGACLRSGSREQIRERYQTALANHVEALTPVSDDNADRMDTFLRWASVSGTYTYNMFINIWTVGRERNIYFDNHVDDLSMQIPTDLRRRQVLHFWTLYHLRKRLLAIPNANDLLPPGTPRVFSTIAQKARPLVGMFRRKAKQRSKRPVLTTSGSWLLAHEMYRKDPAYHERLDMLFNDESCFPGEIFDRNEVANIWSSFNAGNINLSFQLESLLAFAVLQKRLSLYRIDL